MACAWLFTNAIYEITPVHQLTLFNSPSRVTTLCFDYTRTAVGGLVALINKRALGQLHVIADGVAVL